MTVSGIGYDVHQFAAASAGRSLVLGGVVIPHERGLQGHSDADVLSHAVADAILGALGLPDIGYYFPPSDESIEGISSLKILEKCRELAEGEGARILNVDSTVVAEAPKVLPYREAMKEAMAEVLGLSVKRVNVKATTNEQMGFIGREEGMAALATAAVELPEETNG